MQLKAAHLVSVLIVAAVLLAALPSPAAMRQYQGPHETRASITTTTVATIVTTTKIVSTTTRRSSATVHSSAFSDPSIVPYSICVVRAGVEQSDGTVMWMPGYSYPGTPISQCQNMTEVLGQDVLGRTIVINQFIT